MPIIDLRRVEPGSPVEVSEELVVTINGYGCLDDSTLKNRLTSQSTGTHVWFFEAGQSTYLPLLSEEERRRLRSYKFGEDRESYLFSHGLLRVLLGYYLGLDPRFVPVNTGSSGRPSVPHLERSGVKLSLSHSGRAVMYAISRQRVGVDVERIRGDVDFDSLASSLLTAGDANRFKNLPQTDKMNLFYKIWTARESAYKAVGGKLADYQTKIDDSLNPGLSIGGLTLGLRVHFFKVFNDYLAALTVTNNG